MRIDFDPAKSAKNAQDRKLPFDLVADFDWQTALYSEDDRNRYPEQRFVALGYIGDRLHVLCFTPIEGGVRIISFRKANNREVIRYGQKTTNR